MKSSTVYSIGNPGTFDITDKSDPQYYIARFSHEMSQNFYNLNSAGFSFKQIEESDIDAAEEAYDTWAGNIESWFATAVQESMDGDPISSVPGIPDITAILPWLTGNPLLMVLAKIAIQIALAWIRKKLDPDTTSKEIAQKLEECFLGPSGEQLIQMLGNTPLEIIFSRRGEYEDFLYSDRPET